MFHRTISVWQGIALYVGAVVGSGILILPGMTAGVAGADAVISWIGMIVLSIPLAYTFALLAQEFPSSGGVSTFVEKAFGRYASAIIGWFYFLAAAVGQMIVPLTGGMYVVYALQLNYEMAYIVAGVLLLLAVISNYYGMKTSGWVQLIVSGLCLLLLLGTILSALPLIDWGSIKPRVSVHTLPLVGTAGMLIF